MDERPGSELRLQRAIDPERDHVRGGNTTEQPIRVVAYVDLLCPYCQRLRQVFARLREALGERFVYVFRHFPNARAHPGAELVARGAEAAANQGRFWEFHDRVFDGEPPRDEKQLLELARSLDLDVDRFVRDLHDEQTRIRVQDDLEDGRRNGVTGTPTLFVDGIRYDGAWDFYSLLEALERPVAARLQRSARVFASLPASGGLVLLLTAVAALVFANTPLAGVYQRAIEFPIGVGPPGHALSLTVREWLSEGLLGIFFLLVGLEIRRELTAGALTNRRAALLPLLAAIGGVVTPAAIYLAFNPGRTAHGWSVPTATDIAFTLGILAVLGPRISPGLRVFVASLAVIDDILSVLVLAIFHPRSFSPVWLLGCLATTAVLFVFNRTRVYATWPYVIVAAFLWFSLHAAGVHAALAGAVLAFLLPTQPTPAAGPLLAQAATALAALDHAQHEAKRAEKTARVEEPIWDWASRNLSAASQRLLPTAERIERAVAPWTAFVVLPLFAFSATGVPLKLDFSSPDASRIFIGIVVALVVGKPLGIVLTSWLAVRARVGLAPDGVGLRDIVGAACLCGVADTVALVMAERSFELPSDLATAKIALLAGSALAAAVGVIVIVLMSRRAPATTAE
ncbi:MAG: Na+/H+ antiporter NhaA [Polyangiales bacterium]